MKPVQLIPFTPPGDQTRSQRTVFVTVDKDAREITALFTLRGDTGAVKWPAAGTPAQGADLWKHTCFELFLTAPNNQAYWEYNFSPSRQWAVYAFEAYRQPTPLPAPRTPIIDPPERSDSGFTLRARFTVEPPLAGRPLLLGASAVIETTGGQRQYFALRHCGARPDFHLRESFILHLT